MKAIIHLCTPTLLCVRPYNFLKMLVAYKLAAVLTTICSVLYIGVRRMMQVILIMDFTNESFIKNCQSNPAIYKQCNMLWLDLWGEKTLKLMPIMIIKK